MSTNLSVTKTGNTVWTIHNNVLQEDIGDIYLTFEPKPGKVIPTEPIYDLRLHADICLSSDDWVYLNAELSAIFNQPLE